MKRCKCLKGFVVVSVVGLLAVSCLWRSGRSQSMAPATVASVAVEPKPATTPAAPEAPKPAAPTSVAPVAAAPMPVDLSAHFNAKLNQAWHPGSGDNSLSEMPSGNQTFGGIPFDVRGIVQLSAEPVKDSDPKFPQEVKGIKVGRKCRRIHFLQGTGWKGTDGQEIGKYVVHYSDGQEKVIPIVYGKDVLDWWTPAGAPARLPNSVVAWSGSNAAAKGSNVTLRIYDTAWENPSPQVQVESLDYVSSMGPSAPFLLAITTE